MFIQIYYFVNVLNKMEVLLCSVGHYLQNYTMNILLLSKFDKVFYVKWIFQVISYLVGKNFHLLNKTDLNKINTIFDELKSYINESFFGTRLNVKDKKLEKKIYIKNYT